MKRSKTDGLGIFLSTPISSLSKVDLKHVILFAGKLSARLSSTIPGVRIFCAALKLTDVEVFDDPRESAMKDLAAVDAADVFVLVYPFEICSSILVELGYAIAKRKVLIVLSPNRAVLPFIVRSLDEVLPDVHFYFSSLAKLGDDRCISEISAVIQGALVRH